MAEFFSFSSAVNFTIAFFGLIFPWPMGDIWLDISSWWLFSRPFRSQSAIPDPTLVLRLFICPNFTQKIVISRFWIFFRATNSFVSCFVHYFVSAFLVSGCPPLRTPLYAWNYQKNSYKNIILKHCGQLWILWGFKQCL